MISISGILMALVVCIPSGITGLCFWLIERNFTRRDARNLQHEQDLQEFNLLLLTSVNASISLGEATATALKNGHCNGETEGALKYAQEAKHAQKDFLSKKAITSLID